MKIYFTPVFMFFLLLAACTTKQSTESFSREAFTNEIKSSFGVAKMSGDSSVIYSVYRENKIWRYDIPKNQAGTLIELPNPIRDIAVDKDNKFLIIATGEYQNENHDKYEIFSYDLATKNLESLWKRTGHYFDLCGLEKTTGTLVFNFGNEFNSRRALFKTSVSQQGKFLSVPELMVDPNRSYECGSFTKGEKEYAFTQHFEYPIYELLAQNLLTKTLKRIEKKPFNIDVSDSKSLEDGYYAISDIKSEFMQVYLFSKDHEPLQKTFEAGDVLQFYVSEPNNLIFLITKEDGYSKFKIMDRNFRVKQNIILPFTSLYMADISVKGDRILLKAASDVKYHELYLLNWKDSTFTPLTSFNNTALTADKLIGAKTVKLISKDNIQFSAIVYQPKIENSNRMAIIDIHGGPQSQEVPVFSSYIQYLANQGFTIIQPNYRGSKGYGATFERMIYHDWGGGHMNDLEASRKYLIESLGIDKNKIAVIGASFGGYASAMAIIQQPTYYCAAMSAFGVHNLLAHIEETDNGNPEFFSTMFGSVVKDKERLMKQSPYFNVEKIKSPLLLIYSQDDKKVLKNQTQEMVTKLENLKIPFEKTFYDDEGHGVYRHYNYLFYVKETANFIYRHCDK